MAVLAFLLMLAAIVLLLLAAIGIPAGRVSLLALGLMFWAIVYLMGGVALPWS